jgi:hypothetical protein
VDSAPTLAETQKELLDEIKPHYTQRYRGDYKSYTRTGFPGKGLLGATPDDARKMDEKTTVKPPWEDKFHSLKAQRKARGERFKCGDKFQPGHKCNKTVPIHMVEELVDLLQLHLSESDTTGQSDSSTDKSLMHISQCALAGTTHAKSIRLQGTILGKEVLILIDSGSCGSFISANTVDQLGLQTPFWAHRRERVKRATRLEARHQL